MPLAKLTLQFFHHPPTHLITLHERDDAFGARFSLVCFSLITVQLFTYRRGVANEAYPSSIYLLLTGSLQHQLGLVGKKFAFAFGAGEKLTLLFGK